MQHTVFEKFLTSKQFWKCYRKQFNFTHLEYPLSIKVRSDVRTKKRHCLKRFLTFLLKVENAIFSEEHLWFDFFTFSGGPGIAGAQQIIIGIQQKVISYNTARSFLITILCRAFSDVTRSDKSYTCTLVPPKIVQGFLSKCHGENISQLSFKLTAHDFLSVWKITTDCRLWFKQATWNMHFDILKIIGISFYNIQSVPVTWFLPCETDRQKFC